MGNVTSEVIWIKDDFGGHASYYSDGTAEDKVSQAVNSFIRAQLEKRGLSIDDCTLLGASKGGSAALSYAFAYGYKNIIASVPQILRASYLKKNWPKNYAHLFSNKTYEQHEAFDYDIVKNLRAARPDVNLYLITSYADDQYKVEIEPFLEDLKRLQNFNLIVARSPLAYQHNVVTSYAAPIILSLLNLIGHGLIPRFDHTNLLFQEIEPENSKGTSFIDFRKATFKGDIFFPEGVAIMRGVPCANYSDVDYKLILVSGSVNIEIALAKGNNSSLSRELFDGTFVRYDKAWFCTFKYAGVDLSILQPGNYDLFLDFSVHNCRKIEPLRSRMPLVVKELTGSRSYCLESDHKSTRLIVAELSRLEA